VAPVSTICKWCCWKEQMTELLANLKWLDQCFHVNIPPPPPPPPYVFAKHIDLQIEKGMSKYMWRSFEKGPCSFSTCRIQQRKQNYHSVSFYLHRSLTAHGVRREYTDGLFLAYIQWRWYFWPSLLKVGVHAHYLPLSLYRQSPLKGYRQVTSPTP
jgi:hypothetical protein